MFHVPLKTMTSLKIEKLNRKDFVLNKCFCRPKKQFGQRKEYPRAGVQILAGLVSPKILLKQS